MATAVAQVVAGSDGRDLQVTLTNRVTGAAINPDSAWLRGTSPDLKAHPINLELTVAGNVCTLEGFGNAVTPAMLYPRSSALYTFRVYYAIAGEVDWTDEFEREFVAPPNVTGAAPAADAPLAIGSRHPFEFPFPTGAGRIRHSGPVVVSGFTNSARIVLLSKPAGSSGVVRDISWIVSSSAAPIALTLEVTVDGEASPAISVPLMVTAGIERPLSLLADLKVSTPAFEFGGGSFTPFGHFRLPMPYTNGIKVEIVAPAGAATNTMWANVLYQDDLPPCWNRNLRLRAARSNELVAARTLLSGTTQLTDATHLSATATLPADIAGCAIGSTYCPNDIHVIQRIDDTHALVSSQDTALATFNVSGGTSRYYHHEWLNRPAGRAGWLAMLVAAVSNNATDILYTLEGNVRIVLDQAAEAALTWTSIEDMFNGAYYFAIPVQFSDGGVMCKDTVAGNYSLYKLFEKFPVRYTDGIRGLVPLWAPVQSQCNWTTFFYEETAA